MKSVKPTALIVDDDPLARQRIRDLLAEVPLVEPIGEAADGWEAIRLMEEMHPAIALLDIEMPGCSGLEALRRSGHTPIAVFTTAYDQYAVTAFELAAVDYLLKPFGAVRLREALERAVRLVDDPEAGSAIEARVEDAMDPQTRLTRIFVRERDRILPVGLGEVHRFEADGDYVVVHLGDRDHLVRLRLRDLEERLGNRFLRVHRSHLVNLEHVSAFERHDEGRVAVVMKDGTRVIASRSRSREIRRYAC